MGEYELKLLFLLKNMPRVKGPARAEEKIHPDSLLGMSEPRSAEKMAGIDGEADNIDIVLHSFQNLSFFPKTCPECRGRPGPMKKYILKAY